MPGLDKTVDSAASAVSDIADGASLAVGGFGPSGVPTTLIAALLKTSVRGLHVISNNCGSDGLGLGELLAEHRISRVTATFVGENREFAGQYLAGEIEVELVPQGTLAERLRAGGVGIPAFYTPTGVGTLVAEGGITWRYGPAGEVLVSSPRKEDRELAFRGGSRTCVLETAIEPDFALVRAWKGDRFGNLVFRGASRNFNPLCALAGQVTIAEVEHLVETGDLDPDEVHVPGVFVQRVVAADPQYPKVIGKLTTRPQETDRRATTVTEHTDGTDA